MSTVCPIVQGRPWGWSGAGHLAPVSQPEPTLELLQEPSSLQGVRHVGESQAALPSAKES